MFKVGDRVIVNSNAAGLYSITAPGSVGTVSDISGYYILVVFDFTTGDRSDTNRFRIDRRHLSFLTPSDDKWRGLSPVCRKIRQMEERRINKSTNGYAW